MLGLDDTTSLLVGSALLIACLAAFAYCIYDSASRAGKEDDREIIEQFAEALNISIFDCERMFKEINDPTPSLIEPRLFLGNAACAASRNLLRAHGITHILNATEDLPNHFQETDPGLHYLRLPVKDSQEQDMFQHLDAMVDWIVEALGDPDASDAVLVHCQQGVSRSATIMLAFMVRERGLSLNDSYWHVHKRRWIRPNGAFARDLERYEQAVADRSK